MNSRAAPTLSGGAHDNSDAGRVHAPRSQALRFRCAESEPDVVGGPLAVQIAQGRPEELLDFIQGRRACGFRQAIERRSLKRLEPTPHARWKRRRPGNQGDLPHGESVRLFAVRWIVPGRKCRDATPFEHRPNRHLNGRDVAVATEFPDKPSAGSECAVNALEHPVLVAHPVQRRVREHRVELLRECQRLAVHHTHVEPARSGSLDHVDRAVDADDSGTAAGQFLGEHTIAASEVQDALTRLRIEELEHRGSKRRYERGVLLIAVWFPGIHVAPGLFHVSATSACDAVWRSPRPGRETVSQVRQALKFSLSPGRGQRVFTSLPVPDSVMYASRISGPPKQMYDEVEGPESSSVGLVAVLYEFTVDDPTVWTRPWTAQIPLARSEQHMYEYACHEGNYALPGILGGARAKEKASEEAATNRSKQAR
jgi:hypothetical protein